MMPERILIAEKQIMINAYDIDAMGIVSNIVYVRWFEDLRMVFLNEHYPFAEMMAKKISPILMKTEAEYKAPLTIFDQPVGRCSSNGSHPQLQQVHLQCVLDSW